MFGLTSLASLLLAVSSVTAHATFQDMWINGVDQAGKCVRTPQSNSPVTSVSTNTLACNVNGNIPAAGNCALMPGDSVIVEMHQQPGDRTCTTEAIGGDHWGPTIIYMAKTSDLTIADPWTLGWFKVNQTGLIVPGDSNSQYWGTMNMNDNCGHVWFHVPSDIAPGNYLVRAEVIALHVAGSEGGAQFYMSCYQVTVGGSGSASPSTVSFPGAYSATDPGILINIHTTVNSYTIPGPAVYGGGGAPSKSTSTVSTTTPKPTTTASTATTSAASTTSSATGPAASHYAQCGGTGWTGATTCASPYTCVGVSVPYYYQCQ